MKKNRHYSDETKEIARARVAAGEAISRVSKDMGISKSTLHGWITAEDKERSQEVRENRKVRFINKAWDIMDQALDLSSQKIRLATVSTERFTEMLDRLVELLEARKDMDGRQIADIVRQLSKVMDISLPDISTFTGTLFDKQAKASGEEDARFVFEIRGDKDYQVVARALEGLSEHAKREVVESIKRVREEAGITH